MFFDTLLDENAASHIALGSAYSMAVADEAEKKRINESKIHIDFMIGSPELDVDGITAGGEHVPVLRNGAGRSEPLAGRRPTRAASRALRRARFCHLEQPIPDRGLVLADVVEPRQGGERLEPEDALEQRRDPVAHGAAGAALPAGLGDQATLDERGDGRVGGDAPDARDLGPDTGPR